MCGRYAYAIKSMGRWGAVFMALLEEIKDKYNIAPTAIVPVFKKDGWFKMRWGLIPSWAKEPKTKYATFNARAESFTEKAAFRSAWKKEQRCLIPLSGYFEWKIIEGEKAPFYVTSKLDEPLVLAGLWERWGEGGELLSCTIITTSSQDQLTWLHHRMPVILEPDQAKIWLSGSKKNALALLATPSLDNVHFFQVSTEVGNSRHQGQELITPLS